MAREGSSDAFPDPANYELLRGPALAGYGFDSSFGLTVDCRAEGQNDPMGIRPCHEGPESVR